MSNISFKGNLILRGKIECVTGLHIGGSKEKLEIGGVDSPVIRNPQTRLPFIPGSSLKGKMRHLLEFALGRVDPTGEVSMDKDIVRIFGRPADDTKNAPKTGPSRLVVRDCMPDKATREMWEKMDSELQYTEYKPENGINRLTSAANPRFVERVVAGSMFDLEMVYSVYHIDAAEDTDENIDKDVDNLAMAMRLLEHNFLGKSGSRGYGQIRFHIADPVWLTPADYEDNTEAYKKAVNPDLPTAALKLLKDIQLQYPVANV
jgi:CRISPR-associated protein Csm3